MTGIARRLAYGVVGLTALVVSAVQPALAGPAKGTSFGDWIIDCQSDAPERCFASQTLVQGDKENPVMRVNAGPLGTKGEPFLIVMLPLGFFLPAGVVARIDEGASSPLSVQRCVATGCVASIPLSGELLKSLGGGQRLQIGYMPQPDGRTLVVPVSLKGFKAAYGAVAAAR